VPVTHPGAALFGVTPGCDSANAQRLNWDESMRVILAAVALSALSFVAGVAGDLSTKPTNSGAAVTLRIPPPIPANAPRAAPLLTTASARAAERPALDTPVENLGAEAVGPAKQRRERVLRVTEGKRDARLAAKAGHEKGA
jgi:hypothetical protein